MSSSEAVGGCEFIPRLEVKSFPSSSEAVGRVFKDLSSENVVSIFLSLCRFLLLNVGGFPDFALRISPCLSLPENGEDLVRTPSLGSLNCL